MTKYLTAVACVAFLWVFWNASSIGIYVGTYTATSNGMPQCRYLAARGVYSEDRSKTIAAHSTNTKWCPTTYLVSAGKNAPHKSGTISTASGL